MFFSMTFLFVLLNLASLNWLSLLSIIFNVFSFSFMTFYFRTDLAFIRQRQISYYVFLLLYAFLAILLLFFAFLFNVNDIFLSPKNISVFLCILESVIFLSLCFHFDLSFKNSNFKDIRLGNRNIYIEKVFVHQKKDNKSKPSIINIFLSLISIFLFALSGCFSRNAQFDFFSHGITYAEKTTSGTTFLAFQKNSNQTDELCDLSKGFTDYCYPNQKKFAPVVVTKSGDDESTIISHFDDVDKDFSCSVIAFYSFDCYFYQNEWVSSYSGLKYIGEMKRPTSPGYHYSFIPLSVANKIMDREDIKDVSDVVGMTFEMNVNGSFETFFVCNVILDNTNEFKQYCANYNDFIVIPRVDKIIKESSSRIDIYFTSSTSYNKELLRYVVDRFGDSEEWIMFSNYQNSNFFHLSSFWNLKQNNYSHTSLSVMLFVIAFSLFIICFVTKVFDKKTRNNSYIDSFIILLVFSLTQTILYCFWQLFGFFYFPSSSVCMMIGAYIFLTIVSLNYRKE